MLNKFPKKAIRNLLYANIDVHSRRLISEIPGDGINSGPVASNHGNLQKHRYLPWVYRALWGTCRGELNGGLKRGDRGRERRWERRERACGDGT